MPRGGYVGNRKHRLERFAERFREDPESGCWHWTGSTDRDGYGKIGWQSGRAHRFSYEIFRGAIPAGMCVCHSCDSPLCVNPAHLWLGTNAENTADRNAKNRQARGAATRPHDFISEATAFSIRELRQTGVSQDAIAVRLGISQSSVSRTLLRSMAAS